MGRGNLNLNTLSSIGWRRGNLNLNTLSFIGWRRGNLILNTLSSIGWRRGIKGEEVLRISNTFGSDYDYEIHSASFKFVAALTSVSFRVFCGQHFVDEYEN
jgi:hypothetical protein